MMAVAIGVEMVRSEKFVLSIPQKNIIAEIPCILPISMVADHRFG